MSWWGGEQVRRWEVGRWGDVMVGRGDVGRCYGGEGGGEYLLW